MTVMRAAVLRAPGDLRIEERTVPRPGPGEALVRVTVCGVCGTDAIEFDRGLLSAPPVTLGHEFAGVVAELGEGVDAPPVGASVVCGAGIACGRCKPCLAGRTNLCRAYVTAGLQRDGGLAGYVAVPSSTLLDVSDAGLPPDTLGLAQPMSIAVHTVRRSGLSAGDDVVIVGSGGIGSFITFAAASAGARVVVVDPKEERLELARALGAAETVRPDEGSLAEQLARRGIDVDVLFEVSGTAAGLEAVLEAAKPGATIVPVGVQKAEVVVPLSAWTLREYTIVGTVAHVLATDMPEAVRLLASRADWSDVAPEVLPLDDLLEHGLRPMLERRTTRIKTLVDPWIDAPRRADHARAEAA